MKKSHAIVGISGAAGLAMSLAPLAAPVPAQAEIVAEAEGPLIPGAPMPFRQWEVERIAPDVYAFRHGFYRTLFVVSNEGVIVADPLNDTAAREMRRQIARITDQPVRYVAYSHGHFDHAAGGQVFRDEGASFVAHEQCVRNWAEHGRDDVIPADVTFAQRHVIELGDKAVEMNYYGPAHGTCPVTILVRPANLLLTVDTGNLPSGWTMFYNPGVSEDRVWNMVNWFRAVEAQIEREGITTVVGAHMNVVPDEKGRPSLVSASTGPASTIRERREFWEALIGTARAELEKGTPPEAVPDRLVEQRTLADRVVGWDGDKMRQLYSRIVVYLRTGE